MKYCMECGAKLEERFLENEGMIPYCPACQAFRFPVFSTAVSMIVLSPGRDRVLLIKQYGRPAYILVAGYINKGEDAEHAVRREVREEMGLTVGQLHYNRSEYFPNTNTLMLNFTCVAEDDCLDGMTAEVDEAAWYPIEEARRRIKPDSLAQRFLEDWVRAGQN